MSVLALDLGGTKLSGALFSDKGEILHKEFFPLEKRKGKEVGELIRKLITRILSTTNTIPDAAGICVPGISYKNSGRVWAPNISGWDNYPLLEEIKIELKNDFPVDIDSDRACYILGEKWKGAAKENKDAIYLAVGTGIGAGIMINEEVLRGANDIAGAIGWLALSDSYRDEYQTCGDFEYNASGEGLAKVAMNLLRKNRQSILRNMNVDDITAREVFEAYKLHDEVAVQVIKNAITYWGKTAANLVSLFNPEKIIFGGGVFGPAVQFIDDIYKEALKWAQPISIKQVKFSASELGSDAGLIGAGYLALRSRK